MAWLYRRFTHRYPKSAFRQPSPK